MESSIDTVAPSTSSAPVAPFPASPYLVDRLLRDHSGPSISQAKDADLLRSYSPEKRPAEDVEIISASKRPASNAKISNYWSTKRSEPFYRPEDYLYYHCITPDQMLSKSADPSKYPGVVCKVSKNISLSHWLKPVTIIGCFLRTG